MRCYKDEIQRRLSQNVSVIACVNSCFDTICAEIPVYYAVIVVHEWRHTFFYLFLIVSFEIAKWLLARVESV